MLDLQSVWWAQENRGPRSVDVEWAQLWKRFPGFIATPLLVDHSDTGVSHTWNAKSIYAEESNIGEFYVL